MPEQTKLERLTISEVSGVADPANELPGWMVAKARGSGGDSLPFAILRDIASGDIEAPAETVAKARHTLRDMSTGRYAPANPGTIRHETLFGPITHGGAIHPELRKLLDQ